MRNTLEAEQIKFFFKQGFLEVETVLSNQEIQLVTKALLHVKRETPGHVQEESVHAIPSVLALMRKRHFGPLLYSLMNKKPIRLFYDCYIEEEIDQLYAPQESECALLLYLSGPKAGNALFFKT